MSLEKYLEIQEEIESYGFTIVAKDLMRPWGAFLVIKEEEAQDFANRFFDGIDDPDEIYRAKISPAKQILELWYVKNVSVSLYFKLVTLTAVSVILPRYDASYFLPQKIRNQINDILG